MLTQEIIRKKRDKHALGAAEIQQYIAGVTDGSVGEGQVAAMSMAILLNGMTRDERVALTMAMAGSGVTVDWTDQNLDGPVLDKHSTGGVGDKVSLMLAPLIAACGGYVPMISGRGLGHTGGTLDKMDAIPGYVSQPDLKTLKKVVKDVGCAVVGATSDIAPADRRIYAIRDVTGTVESLDLITASILSKKLAAGLEGLVMDVKFGSGAFMPEYPRAKALAESIVGVANGAGVKCTALMTDMNEVLGRTAGNAIEVREAVAFLRHDNIDPRLYDVTMALTAELLVIGGIAAGTDEAMTMLDKHLRDGRAADFFDRMVVALGGPAHFVEHYERHLPLAPVTREIHPGDTGFVTAVDTRAVGIAVIELGGGRRLASDNIDHSVGLSAVAAPGEQVGPAERPLCVVHARDDASADKAAALIRAAFTIGDAAPEQTPAVRERIAP
jgi:thymidine phosphorylase